MRSKRKLIFTPFRNHYLEACRLYDWDPNRDAIHIRDYIFMLGQDRDAILYVYYVDGSWDGEDHEALRQIEQIGYKTEFMLIQYRQRRDE